MIMIIKGVNFGVNEFHLIIKTLVRCFLTFNLSKKSRFDLRKFLDFRLICFIDYLLSYLKAQTGLFESLHCF